MGLCKVQRSTLSVWTGLKRFEKIKTDHSRTRNVCEFRNCDINFTADEWHSMNFITGITMRKRDHKVLKKRRQKHYQTMPNGIFYAHFLWKSKSQCTFFGISSNCDDWRSTTGYDRLRLNKYQVGIEQTCLNSWTLCQLYWVDLLNSLLFVSLVVYRYRFLE